MRFLDMAADLARDEAARLKEEKAPVDSGINPRDEWSASVRSAPDRATGKLLLAGNVEEGIRRVLTEQLERGKAEGRKALADSLRSELDAFLAQPGLYERFRKDLRLEEVPGARRGAEIMAEHLKAWLEG